MSSEVVQSEDNNNLSRSVAPIEQSAVAIDNNSALELSTKSNNSTAIEQSSSPPLKQATSKTSLVLVDAYDGKNDAVTFLCVDEYGIWTQTEEAIKSYIQQQLIVLKNVTWKTKSGVTKNIDTVNINFNVTTSPAPTDPIEHDSPLNWYLKPLVYMYLVFCEDGELYKKTVRDKIKNWVTLMGDKEWFIVHVSIAQNRSALTELSSKLHRTVYDRIKSEFGTGKRENRCCAQLRVGEAKVDTQLWEEFFTKLKDCFTASFEQCVSNYEDEIRRVDAMRLTSSWSYSNFFLLKEGLAFAYERAGSINEALVQYTELEALFRENISAEGEKLFPSFGGTEKGDDCSTIITTTVKPMRKHILTNSITEFEFRQYLFARQAKLLLATNKPAAMSKNAIAFIQKMSKLLDKQGPPAKCQYFKECWIFSACIEAAKACEKATHSSESKQELCLTLGDLYYTARCKLDILGDAFQLLPKAPPVLFPCARFRDPQQVHSDVNAASSASSLQQQLDAISEPDLKTALQSKAEFDKLYLDITSKASNNYTNSLRYRSLVRLNGELALLYFKRGQYDKAENLLKSLCTMYTAEGWHQIVYSIRTQLATCQRYLKYDLDYISSCISLLVPELEMPLEEKKFYLSELIDVAEKLESPAQRELSPLLRTNVVLPSAAIPLGTPFTILLKIHSSLAQDMTVDRITLFMSSGSNSTQVQLTRVIIPHGASQFEFSSKAATIGEFVCEKLAIEVGKLTLLQPLRTVDKHVISIVASQPAAKLEILNQASYLWNVQQYIGMYLHAAAEITKGTLKVSASSSRISVNDAATVSYLFNSNGEATQLTGEVKDGALELPMIPSNSKLELFIPIQGRSSDAASSGNDDADNESKITANLSYVKHTNETFTTESTADITFTHPFEVTHYLIMFEKRLYLQILLNSLISSSIQISDYDLTADAAYSVTKFSTTQNLPLRYREQTSLAFEVQCNDYESRKESFQCRLNVSYLFPNMQNKVSFLPKTFQFEWMIAVTPPKALYQINVTCPQMAYIGAFVPFNFVISLSEDIKTSTEVQYEIVVDNKLWLLAGCTKHSFVLKYGEEKSFSCKLWPLSTGFLPVPQVQIHGLNSSKVISTNAERQIVICPNTFVSALQEDEEAAQVQSQHSI